jgi:hypothetical protein
VFPETAFKFYLDASLKERSKRRAAEGVQENLAARDQRDSERAVAPLMIALGATVINNSRMTSEETSARILAEVKKKLAERPSRMVGRDSVEPKPDFLEKSHGSTESRPTLPAVTDALPKPPSRPPQ